MPIPILFELNQELTRLFVAGSRLSAGDPRIKKYIAPLKMRGEKSPPFLKLAQLIEELTNAEANESAQKLIETEAFLLSLLSTQVETTPSADNTLTDISYAQNENTIDETGIGYRALSHIIEALTTSGSGRMEIIKQAFEEGAFKDPRLYKAAIEALGDKFSEIAAYAENRILPSMGTGVYPFLLDGFDIKGGTADGRRLAVAHKIMGERMLALADEAAENGSAAVKAEAVKIMSNYPGYEEVLLGMLGEAKAVREEVMKALVRMDSKTGIDKMMEIYKGNKADTVLGAISFGKSEYLAGELLKITREDYEAIKKSDVTAKEIDRLKNDISALRNKKTDETVEFMKTILNEEYLIKAEEALPKDKKQGYYYKSLEDSALETLYYSGKGNDFIWKMFTDTQGGFFSKVFKKISKKDTPKTLYYYAFKIGSKALNPDEFYNMFFKTDLYKQIASEDGCSVFQDCFMEKDSPAFSKKIARYFAENMNDIFHVGLAALIVTPDDSGTLDILAKCLRDYLKKNSYYYGYDLLKRLGEAGHKEFKELYELYSAKYGFSSSDKEYLEQFIK